MSQAVVCHLTDGQAPKKIEGPQHPKWMSTVLWLAAIYNILFGAWTVLFPHHLFTLNDIAPPKYPELWQCVGMIVGVYGVGYGAAALAPLRHWPIVLVGLLGKVFGPIGFLKALYVGTFPLSFGAIILTNDLIWWVPFFLILKGSYDYWLENDIDKAPPLKDVLGFLVSNHGKSLLEHANQQPLFVVLLRHKGCTFCREAAADLANIRQSLAALPIQPMVVYQSEPEVGHAFLEDYGIGDWLQVSDPNKRLYRALQLKRGKLWQLFGKRVWQRGWQAGITNGHGVGMLDGDGFQMPGLVMLYRGEVVYRVDYQDASDRPDYLAEAKAGLDAIQATRGD